MKIVLYKPNGNPKEYHNIIGFVHLAHRMIQFRYVDNKDITESIRTSLPFAIFAEFTSDIAKCDRSYGGTEE